MTNKIIIGVVVVIVISAGGYLALNKKSDKPSTNQSASTNQSQAPTTTSSQQVAATISYTNSGFSPSSTTVKSGDTVAIKNTSNSDLQFDSDPHPVHTDDTDLNVGMVAPNETKTFVVTKKGTFGFHNHLSSSNKGTIVIQ